MNGKLRQRVREQAANAKPTPGPWEVVRAKDGTRRIKGPQWNVAKVLGPITCGDEAGIGYAGAEANARLIAAAPELADCVRELLALVDDFATNLPTCVLQDYKRLNEAPLQARELLAKLDGPQ